jgi:ABC-type antimicrobial peptide transport system permease subunit
VIGTLLGLVAGYYGGCGPRDQRLCDVLFAFPGILLAIAIVAILGSGMANVIIAVSIFSIPTFARLVAATAVTEASAYVEAARSIGASDATICGTSSGHDLGRRRLLLDAHRNIDHHRREPVVSRQAAQPPTPNGARC